MSTNADAEMMSDAFEPSGSLCFARATMADTSVASERINNSAAIDPLAIFSNLKENAVS